MSERHGVMSGRHGLVNSAALYAFVASALVGGAGFVYAIALTGCNPGALYPDAGGPPAPYDMLTPPDAESGFDEDAGLPGRTLVWHDEFDGAQGSALDPAWSYDTGAGGWGNSELEYYTARPDNVGIDGQGHLVITARAESYMGSGYTSGRINTLKQLTQQYGRFEARMQLPSGQGIWPAFWMLGANYGSVGWPQCGEIDIMEERGQSPHIINGSLHGPGYSGGSAITTPYDVPNTSLTAGFHVYAVEWSAQSVSFSVDGHVYFTSSPAQLPMGTSWVFDHPFGILFDLAVGGNFVGAPDQTTLFPQRLLVDWVRVYQ